MTSPISVLVSLSHNLVPISSKVYDVFGELYPDERLSDISTFAQTLLSDSAHVDLSKDEKRHLILSKIIDADVDKVMQDPEFQKACQPLRDEFPGRQGLNQDIKIIIKQVIKGYKSIYLTEINKFLDTVSTPLSVKKQSTPLHTPPQSHRIV